MLKPLPAEAGVWIGRFGAVTVSYTENQRQIRAFG